MTTVKSASWRITVCANLAIFLANSLFAIGNVVSAICLSGMNPVLFALIREAIAGPLLCGIALAKDPDMRPRMEDKWRFFFTGFCLFLNNLCFIVGVKLASATDAGIWQPAQPLFIAIIAILWGYESATWLKFIGIFIAIGGSLVVVLVGAESGEGSSEILGNVFLFIQAVFCSLFYVSQKPLLERYTPLVTLGYSYLVATCLMTITAVVVNETGYLLDKLCPDCDGGWYIPAHGWPGIAYYVFVVSVAAYFLCSWGNQHIDASVLGIYTVVQPVVTVLISSLVIALSSQPHWGLKGLAASDLGAIGIIIGLAIVVYDNWSRSSHKLEEKDEPSNSVDASLVAPLTSTILRASKGGSHTIDSADKNVSSFS